MTDDLRQLEIPYGRDGCFRGEVLARRTLHHHQPVEDLKDLASAIRNTLENPLEFPSIQKACVPGDKIVVALDPETPRADAILAVLWKQLATANIAAEDVTILAQPTQADLEKFDPRGLLPPDVREKMTFVKHDPSTPDSTGYLASTAGGQRIYLAREIIDADLVIPVGRGKFDAVLGFQGESTVLYPALSNSESIAQAVGQGHDELTPHDERPLRQMAEEVGWLLGMQFVISVVPGRGNNVQAIYAGAADAVARAVRKDLLETSVVEIEERAELVLISLDTGMMEQSWDQIAESLETARKIVEREGRIVVLSQLSQPIGSGLEMMREVRTPKDALKAIKQARPDDFLAASRMIAAVDWANVYLLSELPSELVEDLFMIPLDADNEVQKLLRGDDSMIVIEGAQRVYATCR